MLRCHHKRLSFLAVIIACMMGTSTNAQDAVILKEGFKNPPESARPRTWWHWTKSNVTREGITKDLEWMKRVGIAGFQLADVAAGGGQTVEKKVEFGSPEWKEDVRFAAAEAERLGLEMTIFSSPGWSLTGGPWVKPEQAMKKLVWSRYDTKGPAMFNEKLPIPPAQEGAGPNLPNNPVRTANAFYRDCAVISFPTPAEEHVPGIPKPRISSSSGPVDENILADENISTVATIKPRSENDTAWILFSYEQPVSVRAFRIVGARGIPVGRVMASDDGQHFRTLTWLPGKSGYRGGNIRTYAFPATRARYFRVEFTNSPLRPADVIPQRLPPPDSAYLIAEAAFIPGARVNRWEDKAGFNLLFEYSGVATPEAPAGAEIDVKNIIDLTTKMRPDGSLDWKVPPGNWTIMRFGYALTGAKNRPAVAPALGYEVDKMNAGYVKAYMDAYSGMLSEALGPLYGKSLQYMLFDSWEAGIQNWTDDMIRQFTRRRGYSPLPYLPVLSGLVVGSAEISDRFLWDFRRTLVDLIAENHYGTAADYLHKQGLKMYAEAGGVSLESIEDALLNKKYADIPMGEFWVRDLHPSSMYYEDVRGAASSGHGYGKNIIAAESFTGGNFESPSTLKKIGDYWLSQGINRLIFHTSAHQPLDSKPGNAMVGTHFHRNITWAEDAAPLITHFARSCYILQQGRYIADVAYLLTEGAPSTMPFWGAGLSPAMPEGYSYDYINTDILLNRLSADKEGKLALPDGMQYTVLVLPNTDRMSLPVIKKIKSLVEAGATILGQKPVGSPGLNDYLFADSAIHEIAFDLWGSLDGKSLTTRSYGKGRVFWGMSLKEVLTSIHVSPDIVINRSLEEVSWLHRQTDDADIYYIVNRLDEPMDLNIACRVTGKNVEIWDPADGSVRPSGYSISDAFTKVPLHMEQGEALFVVFSGKAMEMNRDIPSRTRRVLSTLDGSWEVDFTPGGGAPASVPFPKLISWTAHPDEGIKYFSGSATYTKTFRADKNGSKPGTRLLLDLGEVGDMATVTINGQAAGFTWHAPFILDITDKLKTGNNELKIKVTNEWTNRLVGDNANPEKKVLDSYINPFGAPYQLKPSGLMGPVRLVEEY